jgi:hypothetical protein
MWPRPHTLIGLGRRASSSTSNQAPAFDQAHLTATSFLPTYALQASRLIRIHHVRPRKGSLQPEGTHLLTTPPHPPSHLSPTNTLLLQFTAKQLNRQSAKAGKDENAEKAKLKKAIQQNHGDIAKIYAQNAIRKQNEKLNLLRLASRIDAVASRVQTAVTMRQVTGSMANVVKGMDGAMKAMDLEKVSCDAAAALGCA